MATSDDRDRVTNEAVYFVGTALDHDALDDEATWRVVDEFRDGKDLLVAVEAAIRAERPVPRRALLVCLAWILNSATENGQLIDAFRVPEEPAPRFSDDEPGEVEAATLSTLHRLATLELQAAEADEDSCRGVLTSFVQLGRAFANADRYVDATRAMMIAVNFDKLTDGKLAPEAVEAHRLGVEWASAAGESELAALHLAGVARVLAQLATSADSGVTTADAANAWWFAIRHSSAVHDFREPFKAEVSVAATALPSSTSIDGLLMLLSYDPALDPDTERAEVAGRAARFMQPEWDLDSEELVNTLPAVGEVAIDLETLLTGLDPAPAVLDVAREITHVLSTNGPIGSLRDARELQVLRQVWTPWFGGLAVFCELAVDRAPARLRTYLDQAWSEYGPGYFAVRQVVAAWRKTMGRPGSGTEFAAALLHLTRHGSGLAVPDVGLVGDEFASAAIDRMAQWVAGLGDISAADLEVALSTNEEFLLPVDRIDAPYWVNVPTRALVYVVRRTESGGGPGYDMASLVLPEDSFAALREQMRLHPDRRMTITRLADLGSEERSEGQNILAFQLGEWLHAERHGGLVDDDLLDDIRTRLLDGASDADRVPVDDPQVETRAAAALTGLPNEVLVGGLRSLVDSASDFDDLIDVLYRSGRQPAASPWLDNRAPDDPVLTLFESTPHGWDVRATSR